jgi:hypothetical protein
MSEALAWAAWDLRLGGGQARAGCEWLAGGTRQRCPAVRRSPPA